MSILNLYLSTTYSGGKRASIAGDDPCLVRLEAADVVDDSEVSSSLGSGGRSSGRG